MVSPRGEIITRSSSIVRSMLAVNEQCRVWYKLDWFLVGWVWSRTPPPLFPALLSVLNSNKISIRHKSLHAELSIDTSQEWEVKGAPQLQQVLSRNKKRPGFSLTVLQTSCFGLHIVCSDWANYKCIFSVLTDNRTVTALKFKSISQKCPRKSADWRRSKMHVLYLL